MTKLRLATNSTKTTVSLTGQEEVPVTSGPTMGKNLLLTVADLLDKADIRLVDIDEISAEFDPKSPASAAQTVKVTADILQLAKIVEN